MSLQTYQVIILSLPESQQSALTHWLMSAGALGVIPESGEKLRAYFEESHSLDTLYQAGRQNFPTLELIGKNLFAIDQSRNQNIHFDSFALAGNYWIVDKNNTQLAGQFEKIIINPGPSFGTGKHDTTRLCAQLLLETNLKLKSFLDVGCGSGILSILAHKQGAATITAIDIDLGALNNAKDNFALNAVDNANLLANIEDDTHTYDVIVANMLAPTLIFLAPRIRQALRTPGTLILSGLLAHELESIKEAFALSDSDTKIIYLNEWLGLMSRLV